MTRPARIGTHPLVGLLIVAPYALIGTLALWHTSGPNQQSWDEFLYEQFPKWLFLAMLGLVALWYERRRKARLRG